MKLSDLLESKTVVLDASALIKQAEAAGQKLFSKDRSGLIFDPTIEVMSIKDYASGDGGRVYDTFDYLFNPIKDVADQPIEDSDAVSGIYYIAGSNGVKIVTSPGVKVKLENIPTGEKESSTGATWTAYDKAGYSYEISPRRGQPPLPDDHDAALRMLQTSKQFGFSPGQIVSIEKPKH